MKEKVIMVNNIKARITNTGEIDDIVTCADSNIKQSVDSKPIDWEQRRYELSKAAMQGMLSNYYNDVMKFPEEYQDTATIAVKFADALIKKLKENNKTKRK